MIVLNFNFQIKSETDSTGLKLTLYQYQNCPFCCKVRAYLDHHGFSYNVIEVNSVRRSQIKWSQYKKVPILVIENNENKDDFTVSFFLIFAGFSISDLVLIIQNSLHNSQYGRTSFYICHWFQLLWNLVYTRKAPSFVRKTVL